ncbi:MAG: hypothetical protein ACTSVC_05330, partial [Promethearchaeota archaeon]
MNNETNNLIRKNGSLRDNVKFLRLFYINSIVILISSYLLIIKAIRPFWDNDPFGNQLIYLTMIQFLIPFLIIIMSAPFLVKLRENVKVIDAIISLGVIITLFWNIQIFNNIADLKGAPIITQFGFYWTYFPIQLTSYLCFLGFAFYFIFIRSFIEARTTSRGLDSNNNSEDISGAKIELIKLLSLSGVKINKETLNLISLFLLIDVAGVIGLAGIFYYYGVLIYFLVSLCLISFSTVIYYAVDLFGKSSNKGIEEDNLDHANAKIKIDINIKDVPLGFLNLLKSLAGFGIFTLLFFGESAMFLQLYYDVSFLVLFLQMTPFILLGVVASIIFIYIIKGINLRYMRFIIIAASITLLLFEMALDYSNVFLLFEIPEVFIFLNSFSFALGIYALFLYLRLDTNDGFQNRFRFGYFSEIFWRIMLLFSLLMGIVLGLLLHFDPFSAEVPHYGSFIMIFLLIAVAHWFFIAELSRRSKGGKNKIIKFSRKNNAVKNNNEDNKEESSKPDEFATNNENRPRANENVRDFDNADNTSKTKNTSFKPNPVNIKSLAIIFLFITSLVLPTFAMFSIASTNKERVLGTYNGDYYLWYADSLRTIEPHYMPDFKTSPTNNTIKISLARGEHEGFQVIFTPYHIKNLNLHSFGPVSDLVNKKTNATIGAGNISIYLEQYLVQTQGQFPDKLIPFQRLDTDYKFFGQRNYPFYIDVYIPRNNSEGIIEPGLYETTIHFSCIDYHNPIIGNDHHYNLRDVDFSLQVEVFNFSIPLQRHIATEIIWGIPDRDDWINFYGDHRLDPYWPARPVIGYNASADNLTLTFNWSKWEADVNKGFNLGMKYMPISFMPTGVNWDNLSYSNEFKTLLTWYIKNVTEHVKNKLTPWNDSYLEHMYFFIRDEPSEEIYPLIIDIAKLIHSINSSIRIMETMNQNFDTYNDTFLSEVDIYCIYTHRDIPSAKFPQDNYTNGWPERLYNFVKDYNGTRSKELWVYHTHDRWPNPDTDLYMTGLMQRISFWEHWEYNFSGWLYWSFNWGMDMDGGVGYAGYGESSLVTWGYNEMPIGSIRLQRVLDGIEDYEYFWLLNSSIAKL